MEKIRYIENGWECLEQYGTFDMSPYSNNHPFESLIMFGGVKELPVDQIIQNGLHLNPPVIPTCRQHITQYHRTHTRSCWVNSKPAEFPQLEGVDLTPFPCHFCERVLPTSQAQRQHESVAHKDDMGDIKTGESMGQALGAILGQHNGSNNDEIIAELQRQINELKQQPVTEPLPNPQPAKKSTRKTDTCACGGSFTQGSRHLHERGKVHQAWLELNAPAEAGIAN